MALLTSRTQLSDQASLGASARKIVNERAVQGAEAARESENILSDLQKRTDTRLSEAGQTKSDLKNNTLRNGIIKSITDLKSLKYSDFIQSKKVESATDLRAFKNTGASIGLHKSPDTKTGLALEFEKRKEDVVRLGKAMVTGPQAIRFQTNQALLNQSVALNEVLRGDKPDLKQVAIGAARVVGVTASALAQAAAEGTGLRVIQGFTPLNGGYLTQGNLAGAAFASLNPFGTGDNQISKGTVALRGRTINDGFIGTTFGEAASTLNIRRTAQSFTTGSFQDPNFEQQDTYIGKSANPTTGAFKQPGKFTNRTTSIKNIKSAKRSSLNQLAGSGSLDSRFFSISSRGTTFGETATFEDNINILSVQTKELENKNQEIIPFEIINYPAKGSPEYLYFRAYLDTLGDTYDGEWNGTKYIGRAEELFNYTGFKRSLNFGFKVAAHSAQELKPLYEKLNRLAGTTAPTYQDGLFMQGVFSKITIGDYIQKLPGFFTSVAFAWQTAYPWEIGNVDTGDALEALLIDTSETSTEKIPRVPHILDVTLNFQPIHDFTPQYDKAFFGFPSNTGI